MTLTELKDRITNNCVPDDFMVLVCEENHFLADQYIEAICKYRECDVIKIDSIYEPQVSSLALVLDYANNLNVLTVETFDERADDYSRFTNTIVICDKVEKKLEKALSDYIIKIPKLEGWCVKEYIKLLCPTLRQETIDWLYAVTDGNIYRILNELDKALLFDRADHQNVLNALQWDPNTDLFKIDFYPLADAISRHNTAEIKNYLVHAKNCDIGPWGLVTTILGNLKKAVYICHNSGADAETLGISPKQAGAIRYNYKTLRLDTLMKSIEFLSNLDLRLKTGELDLSEDRLMDYIICKLLSF